MLIRSKSKFIQGLLLFISFVILFWVMLQPLFRVGDGTLKNSLQYADTIFNELAKGSSWFIPEVLEQVRKLPAEKVSLSVKMARPELIPVALLELERAGITDAAAENGVVRFSGELRPILEAAVEDAASLYQNEGAAVTQRYEEQAPQVVCQAWWYLLEPCVRLLQLGGRLEAARVVDVVVKKAIEPGNNFYGVPAARVSDNIFMVCAMLAFYVFYAIWYGFAIYRLFEGFGLLGEAQARENVEESEI